MIRFLRTVVLVALLTACALATADARAASPRLTVAQYRADANAVCETLNRESASPGYPPGATLVVKLEWGLGAVRTAYESLKRLRPPLQLSKLNSEVLTGPLPPLLVSVVARAKDGQITAEEAEADLSGPYFTREAKREDALWGKLGVRSCAT